MGADEHETKKGEFGASGGGSQGEPTMVSTRREPNPASDDTLASRKRAPAHQSADPSSMAHAIDRVEAQLEQLSVRVATLEQVTNAMRSARPSDASGVPVAFRILIGVLVALVGALVLWQFIGH